MNKDRLLMNLDTIEIALGLCAEVVEFSPHRRADLEEAWTALCNIREVEADHIVRSWMARHLDAIEKTHTYVHPIENVEGNHPLSRSSFHRTG